MTLSHRMLAACLLAGLLGCSHGSRARRDPEAPGEARSRPATRDERVLQNLRQRAAYDLSCPEEELYLTELGGQAWGVSGCGRSGTYVLAGFPPFRRWVLNSVQQTEPSVATVEREPSPRSESLGVSVARDESGTTLRLDLVPQGRAIRVRLMAQPVQHPETVLLGFERMQRSAQPSDCELRIAADGALVDAPAAKLEKAATGGERWSMSVAPRLVAKLAASARVVTQICTERIELGAGDIALLREFMLRFQEEQALSNVTPSENAAVAPAANTTL